MQVSKQPWFPGLLFLNFHSRLILYRHELICYLHPMKTCVLFFLLTSTIFNSNAQSKLIKEVFRLLPASEVYNLTLATRDSMLQGKTYYPADNDSEQIQAFHYGVFSYVRDYMFVSMSYETSQRVSGMIEIRSFKMTNGDNTIILSKTGGIYQVDYLQESLSSFIYTKNKKLIPNKKKFLPTADVNMFVKAGTPDSAKKAIVAISSVTFDLGDEKITLSLTTNYNANDSTIRKWLKGNRIYFNWVKDHFVISKMEFQNPD